MKKTLLIGLIILTIFVTGCSLKSKPNKLTNTGNNFKNTGTESNTINNKKEEIKNLNNNNNNKNMTCKQAIQNYLNNSNQNTNGKKIQKSDKISVHYIGRFNDEEVFDTSIESIAKACDLYNQNRDYKNGLEFTVGIGQMIKGFDEAVVGMAVGETKTVELPPEKAYGVWSEKNLISMPTESVPNSDKLQPGDQIKTNLGQIITVHKKTDTEIIFDGNHELAGKTLTFDITIQKIK